MLERLGLKFISSIQMVLLGGHKDPEVVKLLRQVRRERRSLLTAYEAFTLYATARAFRHLPGAMAEVGVFAGASAKLLCEVKGDKPLHLFDTFEGLPPPTEPDGPVHKVRQYTCSLESVQDYLQSYDNVHFHQGLFPDSAAELPPTEFAFVHFDVDLYESTRACLEYFYERMIPGGVMLSHDYSLLAGVRKAIDESLADRPEKPIELPSTQCMIVKR